MPPSATSSHKRPRRSAAEWAALFARFERSGMSVSRFCAGESISVANFYRWRGLLGASAHATPQPVQPAPEFVELGTIGAAPGGARLEIKLDLGGGLILHLVRG
jgi:putative transposase